MLVKVPTADATIGMFVEKIECSWWAHPFWRSRGVLQTQEHLNRLLESGAEFIVIDDEKGCGVNTPPDIVQPSSSDKQLPKKKAMAPSVEQKRTPPAKAQPTRQTKSLTGKARSAEMTKARNILNHSKKAVHDMFDSARMGKAIQTRKMATMVNKLVASVDKDPTIILNMARLKTKDDYTYLHSVSVCALMINLARTLQLDETLVREAGMAGLMHDVGKLAIPDEILQKPSKLDDAEFQIVRDHPVAGHKILAASKGVSATTLDVCLHHHEKMDGSGYPHKMKGEDIQLLTRMAAICDVYDAVTSQRSYNSPWSPTEALTRMQSWRGHFDQMLLRAFIESLRILPVGTLVRLTNDHLAIVTGETDADYALPTVRIFYAIESASHIEYQDIEISRTPLSVQISGAEDPADWGFSDWEAMQNKILSPS